MTARPVLVVATVLATDEGDYRVEARDESGGVVAGPRAVEVAVRPGDEALNVTPEGMRWRALNAAVRTFGLRVDGWCAVGPVPHDGTYAGNVLSTYPLPPVTCEPRSPRATGTRRTVPGRPRCMGPSNGVDGHIVYIERRPGEPVRLHVDREDSTVLDVAPTVARVIATAIHEVSGDVR